MSRQTRTVKDPAVDSPHREAIKKAVLSSNNLGKFNNQALNLEILAEEAAEVIQIKSKIIRFGLHDFHPKNKVPNDKKLEQEIGHLLALIDILKFHNTITAKGIEKGKQEKFKKMEKWYRK